MQVDVGVGAQRPVLLVGDVDAAGEARGTVHHHDFAVRAVVDPRPPDLPEAERMEEQHLRAGRLQRRQKRVVDPLRAEPIQQQTYGHAARASARQRVADAHAGPVRFEDVVLQMHMVRRGVDRGFQRVVGGCAVHQPLDAFGAGRREAGAGRVQPHQRAGRGRRRALARWLETGPGAAALQGLAADAGRTQEMINQESDHRQQCQRQQPAQGRDRLPFLQQDPGTEQHDVSQPERTQRQREVRPERLQILPAGGKGVHVSGGRRGFPRAGTGSSWCRCIWRRRPAGCRDGCG